MLNYLAFQDLNFLIDDGYHYFLYYVYFLRPDLSSSIEYNQALHEVEN